MILNIPNKKDLKFVLFGHGHNICYFAKLLIKNGFKKPVIITHPRKDHERDRRLLNSNKKLYEYVFDVAKDLKIKVLETNSANNKKALKFIQTQRCNVGFSFSCRSILKKEIINQLSGRIFNIHPSLLPKERGGGTFSWRILQSKKNISGTIHIINEGIDEGAIIIQKEKKLNISKPKPVNFMIETNYLFKKLLNDFLNNINKNNSIKINKQKNSESSYLPRLYAEVNGAINWSMSGNEIEKFIRAFSHPYSGAFTHVRGEKVYIYDAKFIKTKKKNHPFMTGRIISTSKIYGSKVLVKDGILIIKTLRYRNKMINTSDFLSVVDMFSTPMDIIYKSTTSVVKVSKMT